jgi:isoquinoline 1-oxidoreductase beta subunit
MIHHRPQAFDEHFFRRGYLISSSSGADGNSIVLSLSLPLDDDKALGPVNYAPSALIRVDSAGKVVLTMPRLEMGEGASVRMLIADELEVRTDRVDIEYAPPKVGIIANAMLQVVLTGDLKANRATLRLLGEVSATARVMLIAAAAERWSVDARSCHAYEGEVIHTPTWRKLKYGELAIDAAYMPIPREIAPKAPRVEGRPDRQGESV